MATAAVTNTFVASTPAEAAEVNTNFTDLVTFLNNSTVHVDGSKAMTSNFDAGSNRIINLTAATAASDAVRFDQSGAADYETAGGAVTVGTGGTTVETISVTVPSAGLALVGFTWGIAASGVTFGSGEGGEDAVRVNLTMTGTAGSGLNVGGQTFLNANSNTTVSPVGSLYLVPLQSGANTVTITGTRVDSGTSGGTVSVSANTRTALFGAF